MTAEARFEALGLSGAALSAVGEAGFERPTEIQRRAIPLILRGRDVIARAPTGEGKTLAAALPLIDLLGRWPANKRGDARVLVLSPTRELARQTAEVCERFGPGARVALATGGPPIERQEKAIGEGLDALVATPGRLLDLLKREAVSLRAVRALVVDEADRMIEMDLGAQAREIAGATRPSRQTVLLAATLTGDVRDLAGDLTRRPVLVDASPETLAAQTVDQHVLLVEPKAKVKLLAHLFETGRLDRALVFTNSRFRADWVARRLAKAGVSAQSLHGGMAHGKRRKVYDAFREGHVRALCASDLAARGLDIEGLTHVVVYEVPDTPRPYVHRIGRTGRAGAFGEALVLCAANERADLARIEEAMGFPIPVEPDHPHRSPVPEGEIPEPRPRRDDAPEDPFADLPPEVAEAMRAERDRQRRARGKGKGRMKTRAARRIEPGEKPGRGVIRLDDPGSERRDDG